MTFVGKIIDTSHTLLLLRYLFIHSVD